MAFSGSGRRDDMSTKLKAQNMKNARQQTVKLEVESRKMEERLRELKMAMSKEKEERETNGGVFWKSGKTGALGNDYTKDVMNKTQKSAPKKKAKIKVLKEEPIVAPVRNKGPGTMGFIAQRNLDNKENKIKGPKCGQCEQKAAQVTCLDCGEDYCAGCFASFHLKGALKKHRSVPVRAGDARIFSPRMEPASSKGSSTASTISSSSKLNGHTVTGSYKPVEENPMKVTLTDIDFSLNTQDGEPSRGNPVGASQVFDGPSLFEGNYSEADSAAEFQAALKDWRSGNNKKTPPKSQSPHKVSSVESGTSTGDGLVQNNKPLEIKFKSGLTYAEKLLLKKHRRTSLDAVETPRLGSVSVTKSDGSLYALTPRSGREDIASAASGNPQDVSTARTQSRPDTQLSIIEITDGPKISSKGMEHAKTYYVKEEPGNEEQLQTARDEKQTLAHSGKKKAFATPPSSAKQRSARHRKVKSPVIPPEIIKADSPLPDLSKPITARLIEVSPANNTFRQDQARPKSRSQKTHGGQPASRNTDRPTSRAASRVAIFGEGTLTKSPSNALKSIATRSVELPQIDITSSLGDFFTGGVVQEPKDTLLTPRTNRELHKQEKYKLSNKVYQMAPRSWRPESSLGEMVPASQIIVEPTDQYTPNKEPLNDISSYQLNQKSRDPGYDSDDDVELPVLSSRGNEVQGRLSRIGRESRSGRDSRAIVIEGDDMSRYDDAPDKTVANGEDLEALDQLDWELASEAGMVTEDGKISRLSVIDLGEAEDKQDELDLQALRELMTPRDKGIDIHHHLRESELMEDFEEMEAKIMADEVKALR